MMLPFAKREQSVGCQRTMNSQSVVGSALGPAVIIGGWSHHMSAGKAVAGKKGPEGTERKKAGQEWIDAELRPSLKAVLCVLEVVLKEAPACQAALWPASDQVRVVGILIHLQVMHPAFIMPPCIVFQLLISSPGGGLEAHVIAACSALLLHTM